MSKKIEGTPFEPTNDQLAEGQWPTMPHTATVVVPEGVFAQLAQARHDYEELTGDQCAAYRKTCLTPFRATDFATRGDMTPETAQILARAMASKIFSDIDVYTPRDQVAQHMEAVIIGRINTIENVRFFRLNPPSKGKWNTARVMKAQKWVAAREWWDVKAHAFWTIMIAAAIILGGTPVVLAVVLNAPLLLFLLFLALLVWAGVGEILDRTL